MVKKDKQYFLARAKEIHKDKYSYKKIKFKTMDKGIKIYYNACKNTFKQLPIKHLSGRGCHFCLSIKDTDWFISKAIIKHGSLYDYSKSFYIGLMYKIKIRCPVHGMFEQRANTHLKHGCSKCHFDITRKDKNHFVIRAKKVHGDLYDYSRVKYKNNATPVEILCNKHGSFYQVPTDHYKGTGCPICRSSNGEQAVKLFLDVNKIKYVREYMFSNSMLRFDFYIDELKLIIEYDGIQHYRPVPFFGGEKTYKDIVKNDKIKNLLVKRNNIRLLRIPYFVKDVNMYLKNNIYNCPI